jgi:hypothetical protein
VFACVIPLVRATEKVKKNEKKKKKKNLDRSATIFYPTGICLSERERESENKKRRKE